MTKRLFFLSLLFLSSYCSFSQSIGVGTNTPDVSAALDITNTVKGLLIPRMNTASMNAIPSPAKGLMIYDSLSNQLMLNTGTAATPNWQPLASNNNSVWNLAGNSNVNPANQFVGTKDNQPLRFRINNLPAGELHPVTGNISWGLRAGQVSTTGINNISIGSDALRQNTTGSNMVAIGDSVLFNNNVGRSNIAVGSRALFSNTNGSDNTAIGFQSLSANTTGQANVGIGLQSLSSNTTGQANVAIGPQALLANTVSNNNTATGFQSLLSNTAGFDNVANGFQALFFNTTGDRLTAIGSGALSFNKSGQINTAVGFQALFKNEFGNANTAVGFQALSANLIGDDNSAFGALALGENVSGRFNTAIGEQAMVHNISGTDNVAVGFGALEFSTSGNSNVAVGSSANGNLPDIANCVLIGRGTFCDASNQVRFGNSSTVSIGGAVGFSNISDGRFKKSIHENVKGLDFIMKLRPVTYKLDIDGLNKKMKIDPKVPQPANDPNNPNRKTIFSGFIAQEVEQAAKDVNYDFSGVDKPKNSGDLYGLRYAEFVVPIVKAVQEIVDQNTELKKQVEELKKNNSDQKNANEELLKRLEKLESLLNVNK